ncbi:protein nessun dorma-like [Sabethes cyaneus]|uniref:protein nessun dorma-like n=1 Tax=Sabethes cyaneus TaxID=53552 RepID=UPI00237DA494|nr:protein nessun dorma-like [Sabethes cyaneus]
MTESYVFKKSVTKRMLETATVLGARGTSASASEVKHKWGIYTQTFVDVTPYLGKAVWRIPRDLCEQMSIKYPTFVLGIMQEVNLKDLTALYIVTEVQDSGELLEKIQHPSLVDLWPIKYFPDDTNIRDEEFCSGLADCLDQMRFFYQHLWMPWDRDDNCNDWVDKHLESRIKFYNDLETKAISKRLSSHIVTLLDEAKYLQSQRKRLERDLRQGAEVEEFADSSCLPFLSTMSVLLEIHLRLYSIKNDMAFLENRLKRSSFEKKIFPEEIKGFAGHVIAEAKNLAVTPVGTVQEQIEYLKKIQELVYEMPVRSYDSLQTALERCEINDKIYLPNGEHPIKFSGYLGYGSISAISSIQFVDSGYTLPELLANWAKEISVVSSRDNASVLLTIDGDYCIENVMLNCANAEVGVNVTFNSSLA